MFDVAKTSGSAKAVICPQAGIAAVVSRWRWSRQHTSCSPLWGLALCCRLSGTHRGSSPAAPHL